MRTYKNWNNIPLILFILIMLQLGCGSSKPSRFYVLTPILDAEAGMVQSDSESDISLIVFWSVYDNATAKELLRKKTSLKQPGPTSDPLDYGRLAQVMSQLIEEFSREVVTELQAITRK